MFFRIEGLTSMTSYATRTQRVSVIAQFPTGFGELEGRLGSMDAVKQIERLASQGVIRYALTNVVSPRLPARLEVVPFRSEELPCDSNRFLY